MLAFHTICGSQNAFFKSLQASYTPRGGQTDTPNLYKYPTRIAVVKTYYLKLYKPPTRFDTLNLYKPPTHIAVVNPKIYKPRTCLAVVKTHSRKLNKHPAAHFAVVKTHTPKLF